MSGGALSIRREIIEYGALPISSWLHHLDTASAVQTLLRELTDAAVVEEGCRLVDMPTLARCLEVPQQHAKVLADMLEAVAPPQQAIVRRAAGKAGAEPDAVDAHAVALFLFAQLYIRTAQRPDAMDVWPQPNAAATASAGAGAGGPLAERETAASGLSPMASAGFTSPFASTLGSTGGSGSWEPLSPRGRISGPLRTPSSPSSHSTHSSSHSERGSAFQHVRSNTLVRKELQLHLVEHQRLLQGYADYLQRHTHQLLPLVLDRPPPPGGAGGTQLLTAAEFDRLALLLRPAVEGALDPEGSPMDATPTPFSGDGHLSAYVPLFSGALSGPSQAPLSALAEWLGNNVQDDAQGSEVLRGSPKHPLAWSDLPPAGVSQAGVVDIQGVCKSTLARGESDFPSGALRITDCHDSVLYCLAPLRYVSLRCCSDCTVVVGAVSHVLRVERCERVQLIAAAARLVVESCHDCCFFLGVNRPPLLLGDNRFLQLAPYCTQYERLAAHMEAAGVAAEPNCWDGPVTLALPHKRATPDSGAGGPSGQPGGGAALPTSLLPPDRLLPFSVPFTGGPGPLCGGVAQAVAQRASADLSSLVGLGEGGGPPVLPPSPFRLPPAYEAAKEHKTASVAELRAAVKAAVLDEARKRELQAAIQAHFKDWLVASSNMRQVYDLARMERREDEGVPPTGL